jgi:hypothetical protein
MIRKKYFFFFFFEKKYITFIVQNNKIHEVFKSTATRCLNFFAFTKKK